MENPVKGIIELNVGGRVFATSLATLRNVPGMLASMFSGDMQPGTLDREGRPFIDRNPKHFDRILDCLRHGGAPAALPDSPAELRELRLEADFYGLDRLADAVDAALAAQQRRQAREDCLLAARAALLDEVEEAEAAAQAELAGARQRFEAAIAAARERRAAVRAEHPDAVPRAAWEAELQPLQCAMRDARCKELEALERCALVRRSRLAVLGIAEFPLDQRGKQQEATDLQRRAEEALIAFS